MAIFRIFLFLLLPFTLQAQFIPDSIDFDLDHDSAGTRIEFRMWSGDWQLLIQDTVQFTPTFRYGKFTEDLIYEKSLTKLSEDERKIDGYPPRSYALRIEHQADSLKLHYAGKEMTSNFGIFMDTLQVKSDRLVIESKAYLDNLIQEKTFVMAVNGANYFEVTVDATQVPSDQSNFLVFVDFADLGGAHGFWSNVAADGSDIRVTRDDGTTELPFDVRAIDTGANTGHMFFRDDSTLSSSTNTTFRVYYNSSDSAYADTDPFGRNNVYQDYLTVLPLSESGNGTAGEFDDVTGNNTTGTGGGGSGTATPSQTSADHPFSGGNWNLFDGSDDYVEIDNSLNAYEGIEITGQVIFLPEGDGTDESGILDKRIQGNDSGGYWTMNYSDDQPGERRLVTAHNNGSTGTGDILGSTNIDTAAVSTPQWAAFTWTAARARTFLNGAIDADITTGVPDPANFSGNNSEATIGAYWTLASARCTNAKIGEVRIRQGELSSDWLQTEYNNQANSATFYTLSAEQSVGSAMGVSSNISYDSTSSGAAMASMGVSSDITLDMNDSGTASAIQSLTNAITYGMSVSTGNITAMNVSVGDISYGFTSDMLSQATSNVSSDIVLGMSNSMTSSAVLSVSNNIAYAISVATQAATYMGITSDYSLDITVSSSEIVATITVPDSRTITFRVQDREIVMPKQDRSIKIT